MNCQTNMYEAHGWMIIVYQHDYSYGKSKIRKGKKKSSSEFLSTFIFEAFGINLLKPNNI